MPRQRLRSAPPVRSLFPDQRECSTRPDDRLQQAARSYAIAKLQPVGYDMFHPQMLGQRTHNVIESLAHQHHVCARQ